MVRKSIAIALIAALTAADAKAALLVNVEGAVAVNRGDGYQPAPAGAGIAPGDRVRAETGSADIVYENGCTVKVGPGQTVLVLYTPPACNAAESSGLSTTTYVVGGIAVAGGIGAAAILLSQNNSKPASP